MKNSLEKNEFRSNTMRFLSDMSVSKTASIVCYLGCITVFMPLLPVRIETQPLFFMLGAALAFCSSSNRPRTITFFVFAYGAIVSFSALLSVGKYSVASLTDWLKFVIPAIFLYFSCTILPPPKSIQYAVAWAHLFLLALFLSGHAGVFETFFGRYLADPNATRGFSFLAYEPSYAATYLFTLIICANRTNAEARTQQTMLFPQIVFVICLLATKSILGLLFIAIASVESFHFSLRKLARAIPILGTCLLFFSFLNTSGTSRTLELAESVSELDTDNIVTALSIVEPSGSSRLVGNWFAISYGINSVFGYGVGSFSSQWGALNYKNNNNLVLDHLLLGQAIDDGNPTPQAWSGGIIFELGLIGFLLTFLYFKSISSLDQNKGNANVLITRISYCLIVFLLQSQISNPIYTYTLIILSLPKRATKIGAADYNTNNLALAPR